MENERDLLKQTIITILGEYFAWLQRCDECIEWLEVVPKRPRLLIGIR